MAAHHIEHILVDDKYTRTFVTPQAAQAKAEEWAANFEGAVNIRIVPALVKGRVKYTAVFYCFRVESDMMRMARSGFYSYR